jgi:hypothetical protein
MFACLIEKFFKHVKLEKRLFATEGTEDTEGTERRKKKKGIPQRRRDAEVP